MVSIVDTTEEEVVKVINSYKRISRLFFKFGIYLIVILSSFGVLTFANFDKNLSISSSINENPGINQKDNIVKGNQVYFSGDYSYSGFDLSLIKGYFKHTGNTVVSYKNIVSKSGIVLPNKYKGNISDFDYSFSSGNYTAKQMRNILENIVLKDYNISNSIERSNVTRKGNSLKSKFFLTCKISSLKFVDVFCKKNIEKFLSSLYFQKIIDTKNKFIKLSKVFLDSKYKKPFCDSIINHIYYTYETPKFFNKNIISKCGSSYQEKFNKIKEFKEAELELKENIYSKNTYNWEKLNSYKLITYQNRLYNSFNGGDRNLNLVNGYLSYLEAVLSKDRISNLYKNLTYFYNNKYLKKYLKDFKNSSRTSISDKEEISDLLEVLNELNKSEMGIGYKGLEDGDVDNKLITFFDNNRKSHSIATINTTTIKDLFSSYINNYSYITLLNRDVNNEKGVVDTKINIKLGKDDGKTSFNIFIKFKYKNYTFFVEEIKLPKKYNKLEKIINNKLAREKISLDDMKNLLESNISLSSKGKYKFCKDIEKDYKKYIKKCNKNRVVFKKNENKYVFNFEGDKYKDLEINNKYLQNKANEIISKKDLSKKELGDYIVKILSLSKKSEDKKDENNVDISTFTKINNKIKKYFNSKLAKLDSIKQNDNLYKVYFKLKEISIRAKLNIENNYKLTNFNIIIVKNSEIKKSIPLKGMSFYLLSRDKLKINNFKIKPLNYIKENYKKAYKVYNKYKES